MKGNGGVAAGQNVRHRLSALEMLRMGDVAGKLSFVKRGQHWLAIYGSKGLLKGYASGLWYV
jgi:hypothetical protein